MSALVKVWATLIMNGIKTIDECPDKIKNDVLAYIQEHKDNRVGG